MGCKKIYLFGVDFDNSKDQYFTPTKLSKGAKKWNADLYLELNEYLKWFSSVSKKYGISVVSCSKDSQINDYLPYQNYEDVIREREASLPTAAKLFHSTEAET